MNNTHHPKPPFERLNFTSPYPKGPGFDRFLPFKGFCPHRPYENIVDGLCQNFESSGFYTNILQFALVTLMYFNIGHGRYWKILFYAALSGLIGALMESGTKAYVCSERDIETPRYHLITFLIAEIFWIIKEFSIPFLNLIKMKAFSNNGKGSKIIKYIIYLLFAAFIAARLFIGYERYRTGLLNGPFVTLGHMAAFSIMALADLLCTISILCIVRKHNNNTKDYLETAEIDHYIKRSSYIILVFVDVISVLLAIFNGLSEWKAVNLSNSYAKPFHSIKTSFILILACDALLFKYSINTSSCRGSSNYNKYAFGDSNNNFSNFNKSQNNYFSEVILPTTNNTSSNNSNNNNTLSYSNGGYTASSFKYNSNSLGRNMTGNNYATYTITNTNSGNGNGNGNSKTHHHSRSYSQNQRRSSQGTLISPTQKSIPISPSGYSTYSFGRKESTGSNSYHSKSIIKNYTNFKPSPTATLYESSPTETDKTIPSPTFGFLNQKEYY